MEMDELTFLDGHVHMNRVQKLLDNLSDDDREHILENIVTSIDDTIMAVRTTAIEDHLKDRDLRLMRMGWKKVPEEMPVETKEDFYKILTLHVTIEEE